MPKYNLSDLPEEEKNTFMKEFNDLLNKHSIYFEPIPAYTRETLQDPWKVICQIFLQKKTLIEELEEVEVITPTDESSTASA